MGFLVYWVREKGQVYFPVKEMARDTDGNLTEQMAYGADALPLDEANTLFERFSQTFPEREFFVLPV